MCAPVIGIASLAIGAAGTVANYNAAQDQAEAEARQQN